jgi:hypothetical protein
MFFCISKKTVMATLQSAAFSTSKDKYLEKFFRLGYVSKGVVYCLLGMLAVMAAIGLGSENASKTDAFNLIHEQPFGKVLLAIITLGLFGFVTLRVFQSFKDIDHKGDNAKGIANRIGYAISALVYLSLGFYAAKLVLNGSAGGGSDSRKFIVAKVLDLPGGVWIIGIVAVIVMISGGYQIYKGASVKFMKNIQLIGSKFNDLFKKAGIIGYISRGIVLLIIGYLLLHAALYSNAGNVQDTDGAFSFLEHTFGSLLMGVVAFGFFAYGVFMFVKAKYEKISVRG